MLETLGYKKGKRKVIFSKIKNFKINGINLSKYQRGTRT